MAIAFDAASNPTAGTGELSWTHTPVGTPRGVLVLVSQAVGVTNEITGVTYGGSALSAVIGSPTSYSGAGDDGQVYGYFLGVSIPAGAQTVVVSVNGTASAKQAVCLSTTAAADTEIEDTSTRSQAAGSAPSLNVTLGASVAAFVAGVMFTG